MPRLCWRNGEGNGAMQIFEGNTGKEQETEREKKGKVVREEINYLQAKVVGCGREGFRSVGVEGQTGLIHDLQRTVKHRDDVKTTFFKLLLSSGMISHSSL